MVHELTKLTESINTRERTIVARVAEMLVDVGLSEVDGDIGDITISITLGGIDWVEETLVGSQIEFGIPLTDLFMKRLIHLHRVGLDHLFGCRIIAFGGDALDLSEQFAVEAAQSFVVIDLQVVFGR